MLLLSLLLCTGPCLVPDEEVGAKTVATVLAVTDPDGYTFEVTEQSRRDGVSKVILNVSNLDVSVDFYEKVLVYVHRHLYMFTLQVQLHGCCSTSFCALRRYGMQSR
jgi:hypothetical protein